MKKIILLCIIACFIISLIPEKVYKEVFRECPAYTLLYQFSPKDTGQSKVK